jgi:RimJ/RimL family protein N-acetyltransferase
MNLEQHWTGHDGTPLTMRLVRASDLSGLDALVKGMDTRDRRWRFHGAVNALSATRLRAMTAPTLAGQFALVVVAHGPVGDTLIADARCVVDASGEAAECGLMVAPAWRRSGIGARAILALREVAADAGLRWLHGSVLAENKPMLALVRRCGFVFTANRWDASLVGIELQLQRERTTRNVASERFRFFTWWCRPQRHIVNALQGRTRCFARQRNVR